MKIKCLKCNDIIESLSKHDFKYCKCKACFIDGGNVYTRVGGGPNYIHCVYEDGHEEELISEEKLKQYNNKIHNRNSKQ